MSNFKRGDRIVRIKSDYGGMYMGDVDVVVDVKKYSLTLKKFGQGHSPSSFSKVRKSLREMMEE